MSRRKRSLIGGRPSIAPTPQPASTEDRARAEATGDVPEQRSDTAEDVPEAPAAEDVPEAPAAEEEAPEAPAAEDVPEEVPADEEEAPEAPAAEDVPEEAPADEDVPEEAPAAEDVPEAPADDEPAPAADPVAATDTRDPEAPTNEGGERQTLIATPAPVARSSDGVLPTEFDEKPVVDDSWFLATGEPAQRRDEGVAEPKVATKQANPAPWVAALVAVVVISLVVGAVIYAAT